MTGISAQLAEVRRHKRLPATLVSRRSGFDVSGIYAIERGRRDPRVGTIEAIAEALGATIIVVDTDHRASVADAAEEIRRSLASGQAGVAAQVLIQVAADLAAVEQIPALAIAYAKPAAVDPRWDAALAGVVETMLVRRGLPLPKWVDDVKGDVNQRWDPWTSGCVAAEGSDVPEPLRRRGVWIEEGELMSA